MTCASQASVSLYAEYRLGEASSLGTNRKPQDSSGNAKHLVTDISGTNATTGSTGVAAPGSTFYLDTSGVGNEGWFSSNLYSSSPALSSDNFAFGLHVRAAANTAATRGDVFCIGGSNGSFKISLGSNGWASSSHNVAWIGTASGSPGSFTADTWVHLALIRSGGITTFYINGVAQAGTFAGVPVIDTSLISVDPGGSNYFDGQLDEARIVTFTAGETTANILGLLQQGTTPDRLVQNGVNSYANVALGTGLLSRFRPGLDVTTVTNPDGFTVASPHTLEIVLPTGLTPGIYDLVRYTSATPVNLANITLQLPTRMSATLVNDSSASPSQVLRLDITDLGTVQWQGNLDSVWDNGTSYGVGGTNNWISNSIATNFVSGDRVNFNELASSYTVSINGADVSPSQVVIDSIGSDYTFSGTNGISGTTGIVKQQGSKVTFTNSNTNTGTTTISGGELQIGNGGTTGSLGSGSIVNSARLILNRSDSTTLANNISGTGTVVHDGSGTTTLTGTFAAGTINANAGILMPPGTFSASTVNIESGAVFQLNTTTRRELGSMTFNGSGTLRKTGSGEHFWGLGVGRFQLSSGSLIDVQQGTFTAGASANDVWTANKAALHVASGAVFDAAEASTVANGGVFVDAITGSGTIKVGYTLGGPYASKITFGVDNGGGTFDGILSNSSTAGSYVKAGTGTQILTGLNTYTGNTSVNGGVLSLSQPYLADAADVFITTGATLDLTHTAVDQIDQLFVDNVAQPNGLYGSLASDATIKVAYLTGTGKLQVGPAGYQGWAATNVANQAANLDFDNDGVANGVEYFMGASSTTFTSNPPVVNRTVSWTRDPAATVTSFKVQTSSDLSVWDDVAPEDGNLSVTSTSVTYTLPEGLGTKFARLVVTP